MINPVELISKKYEDLYKNDQYSLVSSTDIYVPWMKCTLKCKHRIKHPLSELDLIIIKCIKNNINTIRDIAFVLCIDTVLVEAEIDSLLNGNLLENCEGTISITEDGRQSFEERMKYETETNEFLVYMNCITGQWSIDEYDFKYRSDLEPQKIQSEDKVSEIKPIVLVPQRAVSREYVENDTKIIKELNEKYDTEILTVHLMDYMSVQYQTERALFFRNDNKQVLFSICDYGEYELDDELVVALRKKYETRQLLELLQVERLTKEAEKYLASEEPVVLKYKKQICGYQYLRNKDIRELFTSIFDKAQKSIFIIAPWIDNSKYVMTDEMLNKIENALRRNVLIRIGYGYTNKDKLKRKIAYYKNNVDSNDEKSKKDRDYQSYLMAEKMRERFKIYDNFNIFHVGTHEKVLSYDNQFTLIASYNFMSYDGGESEEYTGYNFRFEGGVLIEDPDFAKHVQSCFE